MRSAVAAAFLLCVSSGAQDRPTFRVSTRLVPVTVVAQDKDGSTGSIVVTKDRLNVLMLTRH